MRSTGKNILWIKVLSLKLSPNWLKKLLLHPKKNQQRKIKRGLKEIDRNVKINIIILAPKIFHYLNLHKTKYLKLFPC